MKEKISFLTKLFLSCLLTLLLLEAGLHLFPGVIPLQFLIYFNKYPRSEIARSLNLSNKWDIIYLDRDDGGPELWVYRPLIKIRWPVKDEGAVETRVLDDIGFCNPPENSYHLPKISLITLGDSFTTCYAVNPEDTWTAKLSQLTGLEVYNLGRIGTSIHGYVQIFKHFGLQKSPQIVIMNFYEGNDLRDEINFYKYRENQKEEALRPTSLTDNFAVELSREGLLGRYSYTFNLFNSALQYWLTLDQNASDLSSTDSDEMAEIELHAADDTLDFRYNLVFTDTVVPFNPKNEDRDEVSMALMVKNRVPGYEQKIAQTVKEALATFVELSKQNDFVPIVTYTPSAYTAYADNVKFNDPALQELMPAFSAYQYKFLKTEGQNLGYTFIDLTPALQVAARIKGSTDLLYFPVNRHLTPSGHAVIAEELSRSLQNLHLALR
ncbi:MAG: hypothetical protein HC875_21510 [Anaerolineales bacterium]|nr:hypothetical protein [Anaerolineales bacterium]